MSSLSLPPSSRRSGGGRSHQRLPQELLYREPAASCDAGADASFPGDAVSAIPSGPRGSPSSAAAACPLAFGRHEAGAGQSLFASAGAASPATASALSSSPGRAPRLRGGRARPVAAKERRPGTCSPAALRPIRSPASSAQRCLQSRYPPPAQRPRPCRTHCKGRASCTFPGLPGAPLGSSPQPGLPAPRALAAGKGLLAWLLACPCCSCLRSPAASQQARGGHRCPLSARRVCCRRGRQGLVLCYRDRIASRPGRWALAHRLPACAALGAPRLPRASDRATGDCAFCA